MLLHTNTSFTRITGTKPCLTVLMIIITTLFCSYLQASQWNTYTNTNNVSDIAYSSKKIYTATWGGVAVYNIRNNGNGSNYAYLSDTITSTDGLSSNDIKTLTYDEISGDLWVGTTTKGINIVTSRGIQTYNHENYQIADNIRKIIIHNRDIYVATDNGIAQFYYLPGVMIPLIHYPIYTTISTSGGLVNDDINDITVSPSGYLYCATDGGVSYVHTDSLDIDTAWHKWTNTNSPIYNQPVLSVTTNNNYVALNTKMSIHRHSSDPYTSDWQTWTRSTAGLVDSVFTVGLTATNGILLAYGFWDDGSMTLSRKTSAIYNYITPEGALVSSPPEFLNVNALPAESIFRFHIKDDVITLATWGQGIFRYKDNLVTHLENNCIGFQTISEIQTDHSHNIWITSGYKGASMTTKGTRGVSKWSDGIWDNYKHSNSPLTSDNIMNVAIDQNNKKWFGSWDPGLTPYGWYPGVNVWDDRNNIWQWYSNIGIRNWSDDAGWSSVLAGSPTIFNNTIADIYVDRDGNIFVASSGAGITVFDKDYNYIRGFQMPISSGTLQSVTVIYDSGSRYFFGMNADNKLIIWDHDSIPENGVNHWYSATMPPQLSDSEIYGIVTITNSFDEEENWIACSKGLFMWDGTTWYRYDTDVKRRKYTGNDLWVNDTLYYVDEERLFGSDREARPTSIFLDPFNQIWIGTLNNGFTKYDPIEERFTNYYQGKSPLLSNQITCFGYDPLSGNLLIGTPEGLNTLQIGVQIKTESKLRNVKAYPNPFYPNTDGIVRIVNQPSLSMPKGTNVCKIYDSSGSMVIELKENRFARFDWNGLNKKNQKCSSGIYFYVVSDASGASKRGKLALIREE